MASSVRSLTDADFVELVAEVEVPVLVDFWAPWCGPCRQLAPVVESLRDDYGSALLVVKVNVDESPAVTEKYNVSGVPTLMLFKGGEPVHQLQGARPKGAILAVLAKYL
jgi:thioredoxin 1